VVTPTPQSLRPPASRLTATRTPIPVSDITAAFTSVFAALAIALAATYVGVPELRRWLAGTGGLVDWITLVSLIAAVAVGLWSVRRSSSESRFPYVIPAVAAWGILDEIRYFTGLVGSPGADIGGVSVRSFDDFAAVLTVWGSTIGADWRHGLAALAVMIALTLLALRRARGWAHDRVLVTEYRVINFLVLSVAFTVAAPVTGLFGSSTTAQFTGGLFEMVGATLLVVAGLAAADHRRTVAGWRRRLLPWMAEEGPLASLGDRI
jgi:hypothetical protein